MGWLERNGKALLSISRRLTSKILTTQLSILCNDYAIKLIEAPFVSDADDQEEWAL